MVSESLDMIYFLHNTYNRPNQVVRHSMIEKNYYDGCKHLIVYNNDLNFDDISDVEFFHFGENKGHKSGSLNSVYSALKRVLEFYKVDDNDKIVFSHDDIYLSNNNTFEKYINMLGDYDFISRRCIKNKHVPENCNYYIMMESFLMTPLCARELVKNYKYNQFDDSELLLDRMNSTSPEMNFGRDLLNMNIKKYLIDINENRFGENEMGYFHIENIRGKGEL